MNFPVDAIKDFLDLAQETPAESGRQNLLYKLTFLRDCLDCAPMMMDEDLLYLCREATEAALNTALGLERTLHDQTQRIAEMARVAMTDPLTNAYNRRGFMQAFQRASASAQRYGESGVLIYIDLDDFKPVNDTYGHAAGDQVLIEVARVLAKNVRPHDLVARIGGDEFAVLLTRSDWQGGLKRAEALKQRLNRSFVVWNGTVIAIRASLGFQKFAPDTDVSTLLHEADHAMFEAKRLRRSTRETTT